MAISRPGEKVLRLQEGRGETYQPPFTEARAIESLRQTCSWLDKVVEPSGVRTTTLGRASQTYSGPDILVAVDEASGFVLDIRCTGLRGDMTLVVDQFGLVERSEDLLDCENAD